MIVCDNCMLFKSSGCIGEKCYTLKKIKKEYDDKMKAEILEPIRKIIKEYKEGTDVWKGMDEAYVIARIEEQLKEHNNE